MVGILPRKGAKTRWKIEKFIMGQHQQEIVNEVFLTEVFLTEVFLTEVFLTRFHFHNFPPCYSYH